MRKWDEWMDAWVERKMQMEEKLETYTYHQSQFQAQYSYLFFEQLLCIEFLQRNHLSQSPVTKTETMSGIYLYFYMMKLSGFYVENQSQLLRNWKK